MSLEIGDIVQPEKAEHALRSGAQQYDDAVVVSLEPFILVSRGADMRWQATVSPENFVKTDKADSDLLIWAQHRLSS